MHQKQHAHQRNDDEFLQQLVLEIVHRAFDQAAAVVGRHDFHALGQSGLELRKLLAHPLDDLQRVFAVAHHDDAAGHLALAVQLGEPAPQLGAQVHIGHVLHIDGRAVRIHADGDVADVVDGLDVAQRPHHEFALRHLDQAAADIVVAAPDGVLHLRERDVVEGQLVRIHFHLVLLHIAAHAGNLGDAGHRLQRVAQIPVLDGAQLGQVVLAALVHQRVFIDPAHAGGVRPQRRRDARRQELGGIVQVFQHPGAGPVHVRAVLEDDVHEREAEERIAAHHLGVRHGQHRGGQRVGDLILDHLRCLPRVLGEDDHLHVGEIGNRVQRHLLDGQRAGDDQQRRGHEHQEAVLQRGINDASDHGWIPLPRRHKDTEKKTLFMGLASRGHFHALHVHAFHLHVFLCVFVTLW